MPILASFSLFRLFCMTQFKYKLIKEQMLCSGLEPGAAGWKMQTNPLSYGGTEVTKLFEMSIDCLIPSTHI